MIMVGSANRAEAHGWGWGIGAGIVAALILGSIYHHHRHYYGYGYPHYGYYRPVYRPYSGFYYRPVGITVTIMAMVISITKATSVAIGDGLEWPDPPRLGGRRQALN